MSPNNRYQPVAFKEYLGKFIPKEVGAASHIVMPVLSSFAVAIIRLNRIRPEQVAEDSASWNFFEPVYLLDFIEGRQVWGDAAVHAKEFAI